MARRSEIEVGPGARTRAALVLLSLVAGCATPGQLLVVVDSDLEVGTEIGSIDAVVGEVGGGTQNHRFEPPFELPLSFGVTGPRSGAVTMRVSVSAWRPDGGSLVQRSLETELVDGRILRVDLPLARSCAQSEVELTCASEETCSGGGCVHVFVAPESLPDGRPDEAPPSLFEGVPMPSDAGVADGGPECVNGVACEYPRGCRDGVLVCAAEGATCEPTGAPYAEGTPCGAGRSCDAEGVCGRS